MQTIAKMAKRLDMSAEEALQTLRKLDFDVKGINTKISDEQCDLLVDIDNDPARLEEILATRAVSLKGNGHRVALSPGEGSSLDRTSASVLGRSLFQTDPQSACPYPYCSGIITQNAHVCSRCGRPPKTCKRCASLNRVSALYCRICRHEFPPVRVSGWLMHGGAPGRTQLVSQAAAVPLNSLPMPYLLDGYGLDGVLPGSLSQPLASPAGIVLPNLAEKGFSLFLPNIKIPENSRTLWTCDLPCSPTVELTPVITGNFLYSCLSLDGLLVFLRVRMDTGRLEFFHVERARHSAGQTPLFVGGTSGRGVCVWSLEDKIAIMPLSETGGGNHQDRVTLRPLEGIDAGDQALSAVALGDHLYVLTVKGRLFAVCWNIEPKALRIREFKQVARLSGDWQCGRPIAHSAFGVAFLACDRGTRLLYLVLISQEGNLETLPLRDQDGHSDTLPREMDKVPFQPFFDGTTLFAPSLTRGGMYRLFPAAEEKPVRLSFRPSDARLDSGRNITLNDTLFVLKGSEVFELSGLYSQGKVQSTSHRLTLQNREAVPIADPFYHGGNIFVLCHHGLIGLAVGSR